MSESPALNSAVVEIERHIAQAGWEQSPKLYALAETAQLVEQEPELATQLGLVGGGVAGALTSIEQEPITKALEEVLPGISWPESVTGCAVGLEQFILPPAAEEALPEDPAEVADYVHNHPDRQEVRIVAGATRAGATYCAVRMREHDDDASVVGAPDLVPPLIELLQATFEEDEANE